MQHYDTTGVANCFAGGIFMMLGFGHMLPEASEQFEKHGEIYDAVYSV